MEKVILNTEQINMIKWELEVINEVVQNHEHILSNDALEDLQNSLRRLNNLLADSTI